jgi:uncharacterized protein YqiB (DUF1249 family)
MVAGSFFVATNDDASAIGDSSIFENAVLNSCKYTTVVTAAFTCSGRLVSSHGSFTILLYRCCLLF